MPFSDDDLGWDHRCGPGPDGRWRGWFHVRVRPRALRRLGLHPDQPTARVDGPSPPAWWHAAAERAPRRPPYDRAGPYG
ncbi:hypothetical protein [Streptomyces sp. NPDC014894]|uniref:hypothetical protein n=1 Tax=unclassified Streptomyces TaxID=2593676 RepID=UPI0036FB911D